MSEKKLTDVRKLSRGEIEKRGCQYCTDHVGAIYCKWARCPYHELDNYRTYEEYMRESGKLTFIDFMRR